MSIADKLIDLNDELARISAIKEAQKNAINAKGVAVSDQPFNEYADLIRSIPTGGGGTTINYQSKTATPTKNRQTVTYDSPDYNALSSVTIEPIPAEYIIPKLENKTVTPTKSTQKISAGDLYTGLGTVTVNPIPAVYVDTTTSTGATASDVASGKVCWVNGQKVTGTASGGYSGVFETVTLTASDWQLTGGSGVTKPNVSRVYTAPDGALVCGVETIGDYSQANVGSSSVTGNCTTLKCVNSSTVAKINSGSNLSNMLSILINENKAMFTLTRTSDYADSINFTTIKIYIMR